MSRKLTSIEICAGAGGQALGLEQAGFEHVALVENDAACCDTLRAVNRRWRSAVREISVREWRASEFRGVDLLAGGVPCPPFSRAGNGLGAEDERDLFPTAVRLVEECRPRAVLLENVRNLLSKRFADYRANMIEQPLRDLGYEPTWALLRACDFGVPQLRPRALLVAIRKEERPDFEWPSSADHVAAPTVGQALYREMASRGWQGATAWSEKADSIAPTLVGGSKKHGGPDLGPTQAREKWRQLGIDGRVVGLDPPPESWNGEPPVLTVRMAAILQGFAPDWPFSGSKTASYRQVGNAFPPPVAKAVGARLAVALGAEERGGATPFNPTAVG